MTATAKSGSNRGFAESRFDPYDRDPYNGRMSEDLASKHCEPCEGGVEPLDHKQAKKLLEALHEDWSISDDGKTISRRFEFKAYSRTLGFANAAAWIAIVEGHHPELVVNYGSCDVSYSTHAIDGLSDNDFICAAKTDRLVSDSR